MLLLNYNSNDLRILKHIVVFVVYNQFLLLLFCVEGCSQHLIQILKSEIYLLTKNVYKCVCEMFLLDVKDVNVSFS